MFLGLSGTSWAGLYRSHVVVLYYFVFVKGMRTHKIHVSRSILSPIANWKCIGSCLSTLEVKCLFKVNLSKTAFCIVWCRIASIILWNDSALNDDFVPVQGCSCQKEACKLSLLIDRRSWGGVLNEPFNLAGLVLFPDRKGRQWEMISRWGLCIFSTSVPEMRSSFQAVFHFLCVWYF